MTTTFQKRQKEMKRLDKQKAKAERRAQRKLEKRAEHDAPAPQEAPVVVENSEPQPEANRDPGEL